MDHADDKTSITPGEAVKPVETNKLNRERAISVMRELALPEDEAVIGVIVYALNLWTKQKPEPSVETRERFEKWAAAQGDSCARHCKNHGGVPCGHYSSTFTEWEWRAWQAGAASQGEGTAPPNQMPKKGL